MQVCMRQPVSYKRHPFRPSSSHIVGLYFRCLLSLRSVEELLVELGIVVCHETIRRSGKKFSPDYALRLRRKRPSRNDKWHLDEVVISIADKKRRPSS